MRVAPGDFSSPYTAADDYTLFPPTDDPLALIQHLLPSAFTIAFLAGIEALLLQYGHEVPGAFEERVQHLAHYDALTALPNRTMFGEILNLEIQQARRYKRGFAVLFIDLDRFKIINDTLGHAAGDTLLQEIAVSKAELDRLRAVVPHGLT